MTGPVRPNSYQNNVMQTADALDQWLRNRMQSLVLSRDNNSDIGRDITPETLRVPMNEVPDRPSTWFPGFEGTGANKLLTPEVKGRRQLNLFPERGIFGRVPDKGQVTPIELSAIDLEAEARVLGIPEPSMIPRPALAEIVKGMRRQVQAGAETQMGERAVNAAKSVGIGLAEATLTLGENVTNVLAQDEDVGAAALLRQIFNVERNRGWLGEQKAKMRLGSTEKLAGTQDATQAMGNFIGMVHQGMALLRGVAAVTGVLPAAAAASGASASVRAGGWLFNNGLRGSIARGAVTAAVWDIQYDDKQFAPTMEQMSATKQALMEQDMQGAAQGGLEMLDTRVGTVVASIGLDYLFSAVGRLRSNGATRSFAQPQVTPQAVGPRQSLLPSRGQFQLGAGNPAMGAGAVMDAGPMAPSSGGSVFGWDAPAPVPDAPLTGVVSDGPLPGMLPDDLVGRGISPASPGLRGSLVSDVDLSVGPGGANFAPVSAPAMRASLTSIEGVELAPAAVGETSAAPRIAAGATPQEMVLAFSSETRTFPDWPDAFPSPSPKAPKFDGHQGLPSARFARQQGTQALDPDGRVYVVLHESASDIGMNELQGSVGGLTGQGGYTAMLRDSDYAERMAIGEITNVEGYGATRYNQRTEEIASIQQRLVGMKQETANKESWIQRQTSAPPRIVRDAMKDITRMSRKSEQLTARLAELNSLQTTGPNTKMFFPVIRKMYYDDHKMPENLMTELLGLVDTPEKAALYSTAPLDQTGISQAIERARQLPNATGRDVRYALVDALGGDEGAFVRLAESQGFNAIHNIGGIRRNKAPEPEHQYHAINVFQPKDLIEVFTPESMLPGLAKLEAQQLTKQTAVGGSDIAADIAAKVASTDADVASAMIANNPYGTFAYQGVDDLPQFLGALAEKRVGANGVKPMDYAVFPRPIGDGSQVRFDLLISTDKMLDAATKDMYSQHGVFPGMEGVTTSGVKARVFTVHTGADDQLIKDRKLNPEKKYYWLRYSDQYDGEAMVAPAKGGKRVKKGTIMLADNFMPELNSRAGESFKQLSGLKSILNDQTIDQMAAVASERLTGRTGLLQMTDPADLKVLLAPQFYEEINSQLFQMMQANRLPANVYPLAQEAVESYFERMIKAVIYADDSAVEDGLSEALKGIQAMGQSMEERVGTLYEMGVQEMAAARGLTADRLQGTTEWMLRNESSGASYSVANEEAAMAFLRSANLGVEDLSPPTGPIALEPAALALDNAGPSEAAYSQAAIDSELTILSSIEAEELYGAGPQIPPQPAFALPPLPRVPGGAQGGGTPPPASPTFGPRSPAIPPPPPPTVPPTGPTPTGGTVPPNRPPSQLALNAAGNSAAFIEQRLDTFLWNHVLDSRSFMGKLEELLFNAGAGELRPSKDTYELRTALDLFHSYAQPHRQKLTKIADQFNSPRHRKGQVWSTLDIVNPQARDAEMTRLGFSGSERQGIADLESIFTDIHGAKGTSVRNQMLGYIAHVSNNLKYAVPNPYQVAPGNRLQGRLPDIQHFISHAEKLNLRLEVPNASRIMDEYVRSYFMEQHVRKQWDATYKSWNQIRNWQDARGARPIAGVGDMVLNWMQGIERGFQPDLDPALTATQSVLGAAGIPLEKREILRLYGWGTKQSYKALLGFRSDAILGDLVQPVLAMPWTGTKALRESMQEMADPARASAAFQRAIDAGYATRAIPALVDLPVDQSAMAFGTPTQASSFSPSEDARRKLGQFVADKLSDMTPKWLRSVDNTPLDALYLYTNKDVVARAIIGNASEAKFLRTMAGLQPGATDTQIHRALGSDAFEFSRKRQVMELVKSGNVIDASRAYANTVADMVMLRYGIKEGARGNHTVTGRLFTSMGGFASGMIRTAWTVGNGVVRTGSPTGLKLLAMGIGINKLTSLAERETGWNWDRYNPFDFTQNRRAGGPWFRTFASVAEAGVAGFEGAGGPLTTRAAQTVGGAAREVVRSAPMLGGSVTAAVQTINRASGALQDPTDPGGAFLGYLLTGQRKDAEMTEFNRQMEQFLKFQGGTGAQ